MASGREVIPGLRIAGAAGYLDGERVRGEVDAVDRIVARDAKAASAGTVANAALDHAR